jgi:signal transduction histidine kinase
MDKLTLAGIVLAAAAILGGQVLEGGSHGSLVQLAAFLIVIGGTLAAVVFGALTNATLAGYAATQAADAVALEAQNASIEEERAAAVAAREEAQSANRAKSEFLSAMSHELRTPLNAIAGHVQLLEMGLHGPVTPEQQATLERVGRAQRHLLGLINDILNLARIERGKVEFDIRVVALGELIADVAPMIEPQLGAKGITQEVRLPERAVLVLADADRTRQIVLNLLGNAVKFTDSGGRIFVDSVELAGVPPMVQLRVHDTGRGVPPDQLERIFDPFVQLDRFQARLGEGAGLGLAISRELARGMGGDLWAESQVGVGSTFILSLRRAEADATGGDARAHGRVDSDQPGMAMPNAPSE